VAFFSEAFAVVGVVIQFFPLALRRPFGFDGLAFCLWEVESVLLFNLVDIDGVSHQALLVGALQLLALLPLASLPAGGLLSALFGVVLKVRGAVGSCLLERGLAIDLQDLFLLLLTLA